QLIARVRLWTWRDHARRPRQHNSRWQGGTTKSRIVRKPSILVSRPTLTAPVRPPYFPRVRPRGMAVRVSDRVAPSGLANRFRPVWTRLALRTRRSQVRVPHGAQDVLNDLTHRQRLRLPVREQS